MAAITFNSVINWLSKHGAELRLEDLHKLQDLLDSLKPQAEQREVRRQQLLRELAELEGESPEQVARRHAGQSEKKVASPRRCYLNPENLEEPPCGLFGMPAIDDQPADEDPRRPLPEWAKRLMTLDPEVRWEKRDFHYKHIQNAMKTRNMTWPYPGKTGKQHWEELLSREEPRYFRAQTRKKSG